MKKITLELPIGSDTNWLSVYVALPPIPEYCYRLNERVPVASV
jgi:hypothetical protein